MSEQQAREVREQVRVLPAAGALDTIADAVQQLTQVSATDWHQARLLDTIANAAQQLTSAADVSAAFGDPQTVGERTIIPVAEVMCALGFGMGSGEGEPSPERPATGRGFGSGLGGGTRARPVAAIVVEPGGVRVQPVVDLTQVWLAALSAVIFGLFWVGRLLRNAKDVPEQDAASRPEVLARLLQRR